MSQPSSAPVIRAVMTQKGMHQLMRNLRDKVYPWMDVVVKTNGNVVVTIKPTPAAEGLQR